MMPNTTVAKGPEPSTAEERVDRCWTKGPRPSGAVALLFLQRLRCYRVASCIRLMAHEPGTIHRAAYG